MDEALELGNYLPQSFANANEGNYLEFLWSAFETNYREERFEFASFAFHLLYMSFVSFSIWQIRLARPEPFAMAMVGFQKDEENHLLECENPFKFYDRMKESQIFRFLKLIGCDNDEIGEFAKFVRRRNKIAHPTGSVFFNDQAAIDREIADMMKEVRNIERHMQSVILELYQRFLLDSTDAENWEYTTPEDEITANFIHKNYMSAADIRFCGAYNVGSMDQEQGFGAMLELHTALASMFPPEDEIMEAAA